MKRRLRLFLLISLAAMSAALPPALQAQDCISGVVYSDDNNNGVQDGAEGPLAGQTVVAVASDGTVSQAVTLADGSYQICGLIVGPYFIYVDLASPQFVSNPASQAVVYGGAPIPGVNFGIVDLSQLGIIAGIAFFDLDGDGIQDNFEPGLAGYPVTLNGSPLAAPIVVNTDDKGAFRFNGLPAGDYSVSIVADIPNTDWFGPSTIGLGLAAGQTVDNLRFVRRPNPGLGSIVDFVCNDLDANGINDPATEPGINGMEVELLDGQGTAVASTNSGSGGLYGFIGITPGVYTVRALYNALDFSPTTPISYTLDVPGDDFRRPGPFYFEPLRSKFKCGMAVHSYGLHPNQSRTLTVFDLRDRTLAPAGQNWAAVPRFHNWDISQTGPIFGLAIDKFYNIYATATRLYDGGQTYPAGTGGVIKINGFSLGVSNLVTTIASGSPVNTQTLPNVNAGLGNICYNSTDHLLYVTNLEDGSINVIDPNTGTVLQQFDPFNPDDGLAGVPNDRFEVLWGIAFHLGERRVYFSRFGVSGSVHPQSSIYSIDVTGAGLINTASTPFQEFQVTPLAGSLPRYITDIAFSHDEQQMLTAERGTHTARVFRYTGGASGSWASQQQIPFGTNTTDAAGGVDFGYEIFPAVDGATPMDCENYIYATADALQFGPNYIYGIGIAPPTIGLYSNYRFVDTDNMTSGFSEKNEIGDVEVFDCACPAGCEQLGLAVTATPRDSITTDSCCYTLDYLNTGSEAVYGIELVALDGVEFDYTITPGYYGPNFGNSNVTIVPGPPVGSGLMPSQVDGLVDICLKNVLATPQYIVVNYLDSTYMTFCSDTLQFNCPIEQTCLFIVSDTLVCDSLGYLYTVVVENPSGGFPVGYVNFNITSPGSGATFLPGTSFVLTDTIQPGEQDTFSIIIQSSADLFGDSLCFILSAHDGVEERLCCAEIDTCIAFPLCDPCPFVDASVKPVSDVQAEYCCFELFVTDTLTYDPSLFTAIQATILTPGVNFAGLVTLPAQLAGWSYTPSSPTNSMLWTHSSGITPNGVNYNLFDFCVEGVTSTDSIYIEVKWLTADSLVMCADTVAVYCPFCLTVVNDSLTCETVINPNGTVSQNYAYTFQVQNFSPFPVNTIGIIEIPSSSTNISPDVISIPTIPAYPPGGTSVPVTIMIDGSLGPVDSFCFDIVLRQVIQDSIDITCCYATHCIDLPLCDSLPPFLCPDPALVSTDPCPLVFDPVCGCDDVTYSNACFASNAGVTIWTPGVCDSLAVVDPSIELAGAPGAGGRVQLDWTLDDDPAAYSHFILRTWTTSDETENVLAVVPITNGQQQYSFIHQNGGYGIRKYDVLAAKIQGELAFSNIEEVFLMNDEQEQALVYTFPVPATNLLNVLSNQRGEATLDLISSDGRLLLQRQENFRGLPVPIDVSRVEDGVYIVRLRFRDGQVGQQRVVKME